jgi:cytochrome c2
VPSVTPLLLAVLAVGGLLRGCDDDVRRRAAEIGDIEAGAVLISAKGCGGCHRIPGIGDADGLVGPPLDHMSRRTIIAGILRNTPSNMIAWLRAPQEIVPGNAMPDVGLSDDEARHVTAYLYTLR